MVLSTFEKVKETVDATLNRISSSGVSGASYFTGSIIGTTRCAPHSYASTCSTCAPGCRYRRSNEVRVHRQYCGVAHRTLVVFIFPRKDYCAVSRRYRSSRRCALALYVPRFCCAALPAKSPGRACFLPVGVPSRMLRRTQSGTFCQG